MALDTGNNETQLFFMDYIETFTESNSIEKSMHFYARAYKDLRNNNIICTFAGTKTYKDILVHDRQVFKNEIPEKYYQALDFYSRTIEKMQNQNISLNRIILSGHSLGALVAEIICANKNIKCVLFDSPGARDHLKLHFYYNDEDLDQLDIINYLSPVPNPINTFGAHTGKIYRLQGPLHNIEWNFYKSSIDSPVAIFTIGTITFHRMKKIADFFSNETGGAFGVKELNYNDEPKSLEDGFYCHFVNYQEYQSFWDNFFNYVYTLHKNSKHQYHQREILKQNYIQRINDLQLKGCQQNLGIYLNIFKDSVKSSLKLVWNTMKNYFYQQAY